MNRHSFAVAWKILKSVAGEIKGLSFLTLFEARPHLAEVKLDLNSWSSCLYLSSDGIAGGHYCAQPRAPVLNRTVYPISFSSVCL